MKANLAMVKEMAGDVWSGAQDSAGWVGGRMDIFMEMPSALMNMEDYEKTGQDGSKKV